MMLYGKGNNEEEIMAISIATYKDWYRDSKETYLYAFHILPSIDVCSTGYMFQIVLCWLLWSMEFRWEKEDEN